MSIAKKEEVLGVPIKKRPVFLSDHTSLPPGMPLSLKPPAPGVGMTVSAVDASHDEESFLSISKSDANVITKGKGAISAENQGLVNGSFVPSVVGKEGVLVNGLGELDFHKESNKGSVAWVDKSGHQKVMTSELQLASLQNGKINCSSLVKEENMDQSLSGFSLVEPMMTVRLASDMKASCSSNFGKLPNLDLNVPFEPVESFNDLPMMLECGSKLYLRTAQHQTALLQTASTSAISSGPSRNIGSNLSLSNMVGSSNKLGPADVTLDLQLKPPSRPELGISWKGLAPAPELSLSLFGKHTDEPKSPSASDSIVKSRSKHVESAKKISGEVATAAQQKSPVEKIVKLESCNVNHQRTTPSIVSENKEMTPGSVVKKEPEEPIQQQIQKDVGKTPPSEQESAGQVSNCSELEKICSTHEISSKADFDLNSEIYTSKKIYDRPDVASDSDTVPTERLHNAVSTDTKSVIPEVERPVKCEENISVIPSPVDSMTSGQFSLLIAKSLPLEGNTTSPAGESYEAATQTSGSISKPVICNPGETGIDSQLTGKPCVYVHGDVAYKPSDAHGALDAFGSSSISLPQSSVFDHQDHVGTDGMSQGSAEMDCSDDDNNTVSQLRNSDKQCGDSFGNSQIIEDGHKTNSLCTEIQKENCSDTTQDSCSSSVTIKHLKRGLDIKREGCLATLLKEEGHESEASVNAKSKDKQLGPSDKISPVNTCHDNMQDVRFATGCSSTDPRRSSALEASTAPKMEVARQSHKTTNNQLEKSRSPEMRPKGSQSPHEKAADWSEGHAKGAVKSDYGIGSEEVASLSNLHTRDSALGKDLHLDGALAGQTQSQHRKVKLASDGSEFENSNPDSSLQNERDEQVDRLHLQDVNHAFVNRNERWDRFLQSEREMCMEECQGGRHESDMVNPRRPEHRYQGRGGGPHGHPRNFRGPRAVNVSDFAFADDMSIGRRHLTEDELAYLSRDSRRRRSPMNNQIPGCLMREFNHDRFPGREFPNHRLLAHGQLEDIPDNMMEERFFIPHPHSQYAQGDHVFIRRDRSHSPGSDHVLVHRDRSHSPAQRRGNPVHFHRGRSPEGLSGHPEVMHRSPPIIRSDRPYFPNRRNMNVRHHGSPFDRIGNNGRGMPRNTRRFGMIGMQHGVEGDDYEPPFHPVELDELHAEVEFTQRKNFGERRAFHRSSEGRPVGDDEMLSYPIEDEMAFAGGGGPRGRLRNRLGNRMRGMGEQEDGYRYRAPQGWRDGDSSGGRPKRRRY